MFGKTNERSTSGALILLLFFRQSDMNTIKLVSAQQNAVGINGEPISASVRIIYFNKELDESAVGDSTVLAICNAIFRFLPATRIKLLSVQGSFRPSSQVFISRVSIKIGRKVYGDEGDNVDVVVAIASALVNAINLYLKKGNNPVSG